MAIHQYNMGKGVEGGLGVREGELLKIETEIGHTAPDQLILF